MEAQDFINLFVKLLARWGILGLLAVALLLLIHDPERAVKLKAIIFEPLFQFRKWGSKQYIGAKVSSQVTEFLRESVIGKLSNRNPFKLTIKWVTSPSDPVLARDGTVILRMRETTDQTRNVLSATQLVLPCTVFTLLRPTLDKSVKTAIDLVILNKMASKLGTHARAVFQRHFLTPETEADQRVAELFAQLVELDSGGLFVSIFLEELETLADTVYVTPDFVDKSNEVCALLSYLLTIVRREVGEEIDLNYHSSIFHIGIIMVAKSSVAEARGVGPYVSRLQKKLNQGCETIYLLAFSHKQSFLPRVVRAIEDEDRVLVDKEVVINMKDKGKTIDRAKVVRLRRNQIFTDEIFGERLELTGIKIGDTVEGVVTDVSHEQAMVTMEGLDGRILRNNISWESVNTCHDVLSVGNRCNFRITAIRKDIGELQLSLRLPETDPWKIATVPNLGDIVEGDVVRDCGMNYLYKLSNGIEMSLPKAEVSWLGPRTVGLGSRQRVKVYEIDRDNRLLRCSIRRLEQDPWPTIQTRFPKGTRLRATVIKTTPKFVHVDLRDGIIGGVPRASMIAAGYEYASYESSVVAGQGLDVVVKDVLVNERIIVLDLQRNVAGRRTKPKSRAKSSGQIH